MTRSRDVADTQDNLGGAVAPYVAGKNKIINGDLTINQRGFSSSTSGYNFDRFYNEASGGTHTITQQTFTPGAAPVVGYEATNFMRSVVSGQTTSGQYAAIAQKIEDVRTFAGQTITVSFWAKASTGTPKVSVEMQQVFGSGGSGAVFTSAPAASTLSTSWVRYTSTITVPSISGKTIGTGSFLVMFIWVSAGSSFDARANAIGLQNATLDFWGFQVEAGTVATPFTTASGSIGGELALCQRYFEIQDWSINTFRLAVSYSTSVSAQGYFQFMPKRVTPSFSWSTNGSARYIYQNGQAAGSQTLTASVASINGASFGTSTSFPATTGWVDNAGTLYISAEL